jgi:hypothetical protein
MLAEPDKRPPNSPVPAGVIACPNQVREPAQKRDGRTQDQQIRSQCCKHGERAKTAKQAQRQIGEDRHYQTARKHDRRQDQGWTTSTVARSTAMAGSSSGRFKLFRSAVLRDILLRDRAAQIRGSLTGVNAGDRGEASDWTSNQARASPCP